MKKSSKPIIFKKGKNDIEVMTDTFKVFLRPLKPVTQLYIKNLVDQLRQTKIVLIPDSIDVIVVKKDGSATKY